jgi:Protein of unknown function (DUF1091)
MNTTIGTTPDGFPSLSADVLVSQRLSNDIEIKSEVVEIQPGRNLTLVSLPPFNYCRMKEFGDNIQLVKNVWDDLKRFGNLVQNCPLEKGYYFLKDGYINETGTLLKRFMKVKRPYALMIMARDVTRRKKPTFYFKVVFVASFE